MTLAGPLLVFSAAVFGGIGVGYLIAPAALLAVVGIPSNPSSDFLMRTEGVTLLAGSVFIWAARDGGSRPRRLALLGLAGYYVIGSLVDLGAFANGIAGPAAIPSAAVRIAVGVVCVLVALRA